MSIQEQYHKAAVEAFAQAKETVASDSDFVEWFHANWDVLYGNAMITRYGANMTNDGNSAPWCPLKSVRLGSKGWELYNANYGYRCNSVEPLPPKYCLCCWMAIDYDGKELCHLFDLFSPTGGRWVIISKDLRWNRGYFVFAPTEDLPLLATMLALKN